MTEKQLTPWYPRDSKPARPGIYQTDASQSLRYPCFQHWDGEIWGGWASSPEAANHNGCKAYKSGVQFPRWRGLVKP